MPRFTNQWTFISEVYPSPRFAGTKSSYRPPERLCDTDLVICPLITGTSKMACKQAAFRRSWTSITSGRRKIAPWHDRGSDPLNQMDGSGRSWLSTLFSGRLLAMPVLDLGFTHNSYNNRPMQCQD